jgi:mono/diheme cytochrome c family protein
MRPLNLLLIFVITLACSSQTTKSPATSAQDQSETRAEGLRIYQHYCAACHGVDARGHGSAAVSLKRTLPDLTLISQKNGGKFPFQRTRDLIEGKKPTHSDLMPLWGPVFHEIESDQDWGEVRLDAITRYIESIQQK